jgi:hypothetical protein
MQARFNGDGPMRIWMTGCVFGLAAALAGSSPGFAQDRPDGPRLHRRPPLRVDVTPGQLYRQCTDWHVIEHRATGDTVVPRTWCRWAVR